MISVCIPTYNGEKFIRQQIDSILSQLSKDDEIIISDDSSTDNTLEIIRSFKDSRIKIFDNNYFHSPIYNLENALKHAQGDYIFLSDQDDVWLDDKVKFCCQYLQLYDLIIHDADIIDAMGKKISSSFYALNHTKKGKIYNLLKNGYLGCCMCFKKKLLEDVLPFPKNLPMHDIYIGNFAAFNGYTVFFAPEILIHYRRHGNNASITSEKSHRSFLSRLFDRIIIIKNL